MNSTLMYWYRRWKRYSTPVLAVTATLLLVWSTVVIYGVPLQTMLLFLLVCVVGVTGIMLLALGASFLLALWKNR